MQALHQKFNVLILMCAAEKHKCPKCQQSNFKHWKLPHPLIIHWIVNPGLAFNEIVLGQRIPKHAIICENCEVEQYNRSYIPCPSCNTMHPTTLMSRKDNLGTWRGVACPSCHEQIPYLRNIFTLIILALSFPIWALPYYLHFKKLPLKPLYSQNVPQPTKVTKKTWITMGILYAVIMWLLFSAKILFTSDDIQTGITKSIAIIPLWALGGLFFAFFMWFFLGRKK